MAAEWIKRIVDDERQRDDVRRRESETVARKADLVRLHGQRLFDELRTTVVRDIDEFRQAFLGDEARDIVLEDAADGGFVVRKPQDPMASLSVAPRLHTAAVHCQYRFTPLTGMPPREDRLELSLSGDAEGTLRIKHVGTGQVFTTAGALSEYLLGPVFTGRPR